MMRMSETEAPDLTLQNRYMLPADMFGLLFTERDITHFSHG